MSISLNTTSGVADFLMELTPNQVVNKDKKQEISQKLVKDIIDGNVVLYLLPAFWWKQFELKAPKKTETKDGELVTTEFKLKSKVAVQRPNLEAPLAIALNFKILSPSQIENIKKPLIKQFNQLSFEQVLMNLPLLEKLQLQNEPQIKRRYEWLKKVEPKYQEIYDVFALVINEQVSILQSKGYEIQTNQPFIPLFSKSKQLENSEYHEQFSQIPKQLNQEDKIYFLDLIERCTQKFTEIIKTFEIDYEKIK